MSYYEPLTRFLEGCRSTEVPISFSELEDIIGRGLPPSARKHQAWWANTPSHSHAEAWLRLDWKTSRVDLEAEKLVFVRTGSERATIAARTAYAGLISTDHFSPAASRLLSDYTSEAGGDVNAALARAVHEAAIARRGRLIDEIMANAPRVKAGEPDSAALIREDRDAE
jgi:hypothetical protein